MKKKKIKLMCLKLALKITPTTSKTLAPTEDELYEQSERLYNYVMSKG